jgi:hypothetical protein
MKFKGIELKNNTEAELLIEIEIVDINDEDELEEYGEELEGKLEDILDYDNCSPYVDFIDDNLLNVRCDEITFDEKGVDLLTVTYKNILNANLQNVKVMINVHVDGKEWFKKEDGSEYNEDSVTLEEFLLNIEY